MVPMKGMSNGAHLNLKTDQATITFEEEPVLIAREVTRGEEVLKLRVERGYPLWSGWRRR
jgi:hypothetical protein